MNAKLKDLLERASWTFAQGFLGAFITLAPGLLAAPNLSDARALVAGLIAGCVAGGLSALKTYVKSVL